MSDSRVKIGEMLPPRTTSGDVRAMLRDALRDEGMTQAELARRLGVTPSFVSHFFDPRNRRDVGIDTAARIASALGMSLRFFAQAPWTVWGRPGEPQP